MSIEVMNWAWKLNVTCTQKLVLVALADRANDDWECWPGQQSLAAKCSMSERGVRKVLGELQELGYLVIEHRRTDEHQKTNLYRLVEHPKQAEHCSGRSGEQAEHCSGTSRNIVPAVYKEVNPQVEPTGVNSSLRSELTPKLAERPGEKSSPARVTVNEDGSFRVPRLLFVRWREAFPDVDLPAEVRKARAWLVTAVSEDGRRAKKNMGSFLRRWLARAQQDAERRPRQNRVARALSEVASGSCESVSHVSGERCQCDGSVMRGGRWLCNDHAQDERFAWEEFHGRAA